MFKNVLFTWCVATVNMMQLCHFFDMYDHTSYTWIMTQVLIHFHINESHAHTIFRSGVTKLHKDQPNAVCCWCLYVVDTQVSVVSEAFPFSFAKIVLLTTKDISILKLTLNTVLYSVLQDTAPINSLEINHKILKMKMLRKYVMLHNFNA